MDPSLLLKSPAYHEHNISSATQYIGYRYYNIVLVMSRCVLIFILNTGDSYYNNYTQH